MFDFIAQRIINPQINASIGNMGGWNFLQLNIPRFITLGFIIAILLFLFILIIGGIQWITSGGDKAAIEDARRKIINAITGLIILLLLYFVVMLINWVFRTNLGQLQFPAGLPPTTPTLAPTTGPTAGPPTTPGNCLQSGTLCACFCPRGYVVRAGSCPGTFPACASGTCTCDLVQTCAAQGGSCLLPIQCEFGHGAPSSDCPPGRPCCVFTSPSPSPTTAPLPPTSTPAACGAAGTPCPAFLPCCNGCNMLAHTCN